MADVKADVAILLATYNGERYLDALIDSLLAQTVDDFMIYVSDGGSTDATMEIVARHAARLGDRFVLLPPAPKRLNAAANFGRLLDATEAHHVLFCDQDDVWLPEKVALTLAEMRRMERRHGADAMLLVHTDLVVVDAALETIYSSYVERMHIRPDRNDLMSLLFRNVATGCTIAINRTLYLAAKPIPTEAMMHDHWLMKVAAAFGHTSFVNTPTILYRQHASNAIGAGAVGLRGFAMQMHRVVLGKGLRVMLAYTLSIRIFVQRYGDRLDLRTREVLQTWADLRDLPFRRQIAFLWREGTTRYGWSRTVGLAILILRLKFTRRRLP